MDAPAGAGRARRRRGGELPVLSDVARLAGVSDMTVSRVYNEPWRVRAATRERVEAAIAQLGYRPNAAARSLNTGRSRTIGVVALNTGLYGPSSTVHAIEEAARAAGYYVSVASASGTSTEAVRESVQRLLSQGVDGVAITAPFRAATRVVEELRGAAAVVAAEGLGLKGTVSVSVDQALGARLAVEHLLELGHRTVHHIAGPADWLEAEARTAGWREALRRARRRTPAPVAGSWQARSGYEATLSLTSRPGMTALFVANDHMAQGALRALNEQGLHVPGDVSIVGFDDVPESAYYLPPLTTIRQDFAQVGRETVRLLLEQLAGGRPPALQDGRFEPLVKPALVVRSSTAAPPR